ncbi:hypothetical protein C7475_1011280 [Chitinophaga sp. S165]|nr:hypothetical protein C7475_1011280 [Chitinophaga sp. S165]
MLVPAIALLFVVIIVVTYLIFQAGSKTKDQGNKN